MTQDKSKTDYSYTEERSAEFRGARSKSWFLGIGINNYLEFPKLSNAINDVTAIKDIMISRYGVDPAQCITLFDKHADEENLIQTLDELTETVSKHDSLLIYFSGHGHLNKKTEMGFWIPQDAKKGKTASYIRNSTIRDYLKSIKSLHTLLISDSCFSGSLFARGAHRSSAALHELGSIQSRWAICSGRHDEEVYDGEPGEHSPFAQSILETLKNNQSDLLNVAKLADRVTVQTHSNNEQLPIGSPLQNVGHKGGQYIFQLKAEESVIWESVVREDTTSAYSQFLRKFSNGKHSDQAIARIKEIEDEECWQETKARGSISAFHSYLNEFPHGSFVNEANDEIIKLEHSSTRSIDPKPALQPERALTRHPNPKPFRPPPTPKPEELEKRYRLKRVLLIFGGILFAFAIIWGPVRYFIVSKDVKMPRLIGQDLELARVALDELKLTMGKITYVKNGSTNKVLRQSVKAGKYVPYGQIVDFEVGAANGTYSLAALQRNLKKLGYNPGTIDGAMGAKTATAIRAFQRAAGEKATGKGSIELLDYTDKALDSDSLHNFLGCTSIATMNQQGCDSESAAVQGSIDVSYVSNCSVDVREAVYTGYKMDEVAAGCRKVLMRDLRSVVYSDAKEECIQKIPKGASMVDIKFDIGAGDCTCNGRAGCQCKTLATCLYSRSSSNKNCDSTAVADAKEVCYCRDPTVSDRQCVTKPG